jgi:hypothetical protein
MNQVIILHSNAKQHTRETTATMHWTVLPHPHYNLDLAPSNFQLFEPLKDELGGNSFADDDNLTHGVFEELWHCSKEFYVTGIQHLTQMWYKNADNEEDSVKNTLMMHVNYIVIIIIVSEKKIGGLMLVLLLILWKQQ